MKVQVLDDEANEMLLIKVGNDTVFEGNYWDLPNGAGDMARFLKNLGLEVEKGTYSYDALPFGGP